MEMTKTNFNNFRQDLKQAVAELETKYGVVITCGAISYDSNGFDIKVKVENVTESGMPEATKKALDNLSWFAEIYGKTFTEGRYSYRVVGYEWHKKYSVVCKREDGKLYNFLPGVYEKIKGIN